MNMTNYTFLNNLKSITLVAKVGKVFQYTPKNFKFWWPLDLYGFSLSFRFGGSILKAAVSVFLNNQLPRYRQILIKSL